MNALFVRWQMSRWRWSSFGLVVLVSLVAPCRAEATTFWSEGWEYTTYSSMLAGGGGPWDSSCPNDSTVVRPSPDRKTEGLRSLRMTYNGHQGVTPGYKSCFMNRSVSGSPTTIYSRWYVWFDDFTVDSVSTKITQYANTSMYPSFWITMQGGSTALIFALEAISDGAGGWRGQNVGGGDAVQQGQWVCIETQITLNTPGVANGVLRTWYDGVPQINRTDVLLRPATNVSVGASQVSSPNMTFNNVKMYAQDGVGNIYIDQYTVSDTRIGCTAQPPDATPPLPPSNVMVQ